MSDFEEIEHTADWALRIRAPDQPGSIQFSNFSLLENRETHELELYITPIGVDAKDWRNADCYKYTLTVSQEEHKDDDPPEN